MKRTLVFGAIMFCAMLWLNPLEAQQQSRPMPANDGAAVMQDKAVLEMQRMNDVHKVMSNVELARNAVLPVQTSRNSNKAESSPYIYSKDLSVERQLEMVKAYMQNAFAAASEAGNGAEATHVFVAGSGAVQSMIKATYVGDERKELTSCDFPYRAGSATLYPLWGTWNGHAYEGIWVYRGESGLSLAGYFTYDPFTNEAGQLTSAYQTGNTDNMQSDACAYDYAANKVYTLTNQYNDDYSAITGIAFHSAEKGTAVFVPAFSIAFETPSTNIPVSMAMDKTGKMYIFCTDGKVYTVKQTGETYALEEAGDTRQPTGAYSQSAAWDYRSDIVYWANVNIEGENPAACLSVWDPAKATGSAKVDNFLQATGLASVYYVDNNARPVADFGLTYGNGKVRAVFTVPALTLNDEAIASLAEVEIVKVTADGLSPVWTKQNPVPGERMEQELENVGTNGETVTLAIRVKDNNGKYSRYATASVLLFEVRLPYVNGFETDAADPMAAIVVVDPESAGGMERTTAEKHEGEYSFKISGVYASQDQRQLKLMGMPVGKKGGYTVSFWAKASVADALVYAFDDADFENLVRVGTEWTEIKLPYAATATGQMSLNLQGYGGISGDVNTVYYIDDIKVEETASPNVPDVLTINSISASGGNALSAVLNITLPSLSVSEAPLASVAGIVVHYADAASFETYEVDTVEANTVGATADFTVKVERAGQYYFRAYAYNEFGPCPEYSAYTGLSPWIGPKNMPVSMATAAVDEDGHVKVEWADPAIANEISWTKNDTMARRLTIDAKTAFKYAQAFDAADLASYGMTTPKALQIGFVPGSKTAAYTLVLAYGGTEEEEIYRKAVDAAGLREGEWYYTTVDETVMIDVTKSLWVIVEVAASENQGYACAVSATTVAEGKSNKMWYNGSWNTITDLFNKGTGSVLVSLKAEDRNTVMAPDKGYKVYRGKMDAAFQDYESLATVETGNNYVDQTWRDLAFGRYKYAVVAVWNEADATPVMTNVLNKDMEFTVRFKITSNAGSAEGAEVYVVDTAGTVNYEAVANAEGEAVIAGKVWRDVYNYEVTLPFHQTLEGELNLTQDTLIDVVLRETVLNPELTVEVTGKDVVMDYGVNRHNWIDDVESYSDFAIANIGDYILSEPAEKGGIKDVTWTNADAPQSWIVFNPDKTTPALSLAAHSGKKMFAAFYNAKAQNNDYLIRPVSKGGGEFIFYCRAYAASYPEAMEVVYSSTTADVSAFQTIQAYNKISVTSWTPVVADIPEDAKYIGIRCISNDAFLFMVDDLAYYTEESANPTGYELYLDGVKVKDAKADELTYTFKELSFGEHKVGVKAIYASGASDLVENTVNISAEAKPIDLAADVQGSTAVLTWNMPEGFTAKSYQVFLGNEMVADNLTEMSYTFTDLQNGQYTAAVTAVYETGVSEKATVDFLIAGVGIDDVLTQPQGFIYPNPCNGTFYLNAERAGFAEVYSLTGTKVQHVVIPEAGTYSFNLQSAHGMYMVKFVTDGKTSLFKVVVR